jgi:small subunit ribosomal protein S17
MKKVKKLKQGVVVSKSGDKTVVIVVHRYEMHPKYKRRYRISKKFHAHDEANTVCVGDKVYFQESIPLSKKKRWRVLSEEEVSSFLQK